LVDRFTNEITKPIIVRPGLGGHSYEYKKAVKSRQLKKKQLIFFSELFRINPGASFKPVTLINTLKHNLDKMIALGKVLRKRPTDAEQLLWKQLRLKQLEGLKFRRQQPIDNYIVDFFCPRLNLAIEIDGATHGEKIGYDENRQKNLEKLGLKFLRYSERQIRENLWAVIEDIEQWIKNNQEEE